MWKRLGRLLCRLGLHDWEFVDHSIDRDLWRIVPFHSVCSRCGKGDTE